jgi:hypothetical protein
MVGTSRKTMSQPSHDALLDQVEAQSHADCEGGVMDREQIQRDGEKAVLAAWDRALTRPSETAVDTVQARLAVVAAQAPLLAAIDELKAELPDTFFAGLELHQRVKRMVELWQKAVSAANALDRVLALHTDEGFDICYSCDQPWPCETVRAATDG